MLVLVGTVLLSMPFAVEDGQAPGLMTAVFTATSAVCVTGLVVVDTATYWSTAGELIILGLIQAGGLGIMTLASLLGLLVFRRFGLRMRLTAQTETKSIGLGEVRRLVGRVILVSLIFELVLWVMLALRLYVGYDRRVGAAAYEGLFHSVSAFNNAGFALYSDSLMGFVTDPWICLPIAVAVIVGGIGFPVVLELWRRFRTPRAWSLHTKITVLATAVLLAVGTVLITALEWDNPKTMGAAGWSDKLLAGFFASASARTAGFNSLDVAGMEPATLLVHDMLMFIGGGSAGTAGGIKVATFALLAFVILAEARGEPTVHVLGRKLSDGVQRQALTIVLLGIGLVMSATVALLAVTSLDLDQVLFEVVSAFATVGLSTGITDDLPVFGQLVLIVLMFVGRLGPITLATAMALRERVRRYELPEERTIVG
ncbi:potassium uptake TrkH family protein [Pseudonocardia eucalypti]|uniref:TrkH family potassium uptake protein n=1 Tax=Pseudonocardia eucalypti TaxID=648755 RepID=UPI0017A41B79|nr:potassium uptake TrkH family protein [Pseudonocardia eucalypti]